MMSLRVSVRPVSAEVLTDKHKTALAQLRTKEAQTKGLQKELESMRREYDLIEEEVIMLRRKTTDPESLEEMLAAATGEKKKKKGKKGLAALDGEEDSDFEEMMAVANLKKGPMAEGAPAYAGWLWKLLAGVWAVTAAALAAAVVALVASLLHAEGCARGTRAGTRPAAQHRMRPEHLSHPVRPSVRPRRLADRVGELSGELKAVKLLRVMARRSLSRSFLRSFAPSLLIASRSLQPRAPSPLTRRRRVRRAMPLPPRIRSRTGRSTRRTGRRLWRRTTLRTSCPRARGGHPPPDGRSTATPNTLPDTPALSRLGLAAPDPRAADVCRVLCPNLSCEGYGGGAGAGAHTHSPQQISYSRPPPSECPQLLRQTIPFPRAQAEVAARRSTRTSPPRAPASWPAGCAAPSSLPSRSLSRARRVCLA